MPICDYNCLDLINNMISQGWPQEKQYVDVKDRDNGWIVGLVLSKTENHIKIRGQGWSSKYDEILPYSPCIYLQRNSKIQPFRSNTRCHTCNKKSTRIREHWKSTALDIQNRLLILQGFISNPKSKTVRELTQFIRGEHYFYIDFLMGSTFVKMQKVYQYFRKHIQLVNSFIDSILEIRINNFFPENNRPEPAQKDYWQKGYSECFYEIFQPLINMLNAIKIQDQYRTYNFQKNNEKIIKLTTGFDLHSQYILNEIITQGTIQKLKKLIIHIYQDCYQNDSIRLPFFFIYFILKLFFLYSRGYDKKQTSQAQILEQRQIFEHLSSICTKEVSSLTIQDLKKQMIEDEIELVFIIIKQYNIKIFPQENSKNLQSIELIQVDYYLKFIKSNNLDRKLKGLAKIKQQCENLHLLNQKLGIQGLKPAFAEILHRLEFQKILFEQNQHTQVLKKSIELIGLIYKLQIIDIIPIIYCWKQCINKQGIVVKHLQQQWVDIAQKISLEEFQEFIHVVHDYEVSQPEINTTVQYIGFYFKLIYNLTKNLTCLIKAKQNHPLLEKFQKTTSQMIAQAYLFLSSDCHQENRAYMIEVYSKIVINSTQCRSIINNLFCGLVKQTNFKITLSILLEIYSSNQPYVFYVPQNYFKLVLSCLRALELSIIQLISLLKLLTKIFLISRENIRLYVIKNCDFKQMWQIFQSFHEEKRTVLYDWMAPHRKHQLEHKSNINPSFSVQLKNYILMEVFCEENFRNFDNITKKQMQLILQFFTQKNVREVKLEEKYYYSDLRVMYRLNSIQLYKQAILWKIFEKSQSNEVVQLLSRKLVHFYFFYSPSVAYNLKKGRIDEFLYKIKQFLQLAHKQNNKTIIFNCLALLKKVIRLTREQIKGDGEVNTNNVIIKINFSFQSKIQHIDVRYEDTIGRIKQKIAKHLGLRPTQIKMFNNKNQQLSFDTKDSPNYYFSDKSFKIVRVAKEEQTLSHFVLHFLKEELQMTLIKLFEKQETSLQIYEVLEQLQYKQSYNIILKKINQIIDNYSWEIVPHRKFIISYYLIQLKILGKFIQQSAITQELLNTLNVHRLKTIMTYKIENNFQINFLLILTSFLNKAIKIEAFASIKTVFENHCFGVMLQLINFATKNHCDQFEKEWIGKIQQNCINFLEIAVTSHSMFVHLFSNSYFYKILEFLYFVTGFQDIKSPLNKKIRAYFKEYKNSEIKCKQTETKVTVFYTKKFYSRVISSFLTKQLKNTKGKAQFFANISQILSLISPQIFQSLIVRQNNGEPPFLAHIHYFIQKYSLNSELKGYVYLDDFIIDHLKLLKSIIQNRPELKDINLIKFILTSCIGLKENGNIEPYIRNTSIIIAAFQLIIEILKNNNNQEQFSFLIKALAPCQKSTFWREQGKWELSAQKQAKQKYCGLQNPGCICYMNSILQQIFMIQEFRNGIFQLQIDKSNSIKMEQEQQDNNNQSKKESPSILKALKQLFLELALTSQNKIDPTTFASTIRTGDNFPLIRMNEQMDIDEFSSILFDKLEKELQQIGSKNLVRELFGGVYLNQIVSAECPHKSQREQSFISISLDVKRNIHESLKSFVRVDVLDGDNKYYCQICDKKVKAMKCQTIKTFPPYIILCLKRFEFNYETQTKIKINDYCEFSHQLRLKDFSTQDFNKSSMTEEDNETKEILNTDDTQFNYRLRGVVVHTGSADSGHYYSYIVDGEGDWYQFNDEEVSQFDHRKLPEQAFGGRGGQYDDCRIKNAYLLIYERDKLDKKELQSFDKIINIQQNKKTIDLINERNQQNMKFLLVFSDIYEDLVSQLYVNFCSLQTQARTQGFKNDWYEFFLNYYLMVQARKQGKSSFLQFSAILQQLIKNRHSIGQKYIQIFSNHCFIQQFIVYNGNRQKCKIMANILSTAIIQYIHYNPKKQITESLTLSFFFTSVTATLILLPNVSQLTDLLIRIYEYCFNFNRSLLISIIKTYDYTTIILSYICGYIIPNNVKSGYREQVKAIKKKSNLSYIIKIDCLGKKYTSTDLSLEWKFLRLNVEYIIILAPENQNTQYIEKIISLLRSTLKQMSDQQSLLSIYKSHNYTGVYSMYKVFKQIDILHSLFDGLEKAIINYDSFRLRPFMLLIIMFLNDEDNSTEQFDIIVSALENAYKHNQKYDLEIDMFNQWIVRFLAANPIFLKCFRERVGFTEMILSWLKKNYIANPQVIKKHKYPNSQKYLNQYYGIMVSSDPKDYQSNNFKLKQIYQSLLKGTFELKSKIIRVQEPMEPQKKVKYFDSKLSKWVNGTIVSNKFGYLQIEIEGKVQNKVFVFEDSQKVKLAVPMSQEISCLQQVNSDCSYEQSGESEQS